MAEKTNGANWECLSLCANKTDKKGRAVSEEEGQTYASNRGMKYYEVSAQSGNECRSFSDVVRLCTMIERRI